MSSLVGKGVDAVLNSMDIDAIVQKVDINSLLERIDLDRLIDRLPVEKLVARIDVNQLVERSNLEAIIARSSSSVIQQIVDLARVTIVQLDIFAFRLSRCQCLQQEVHLPPAPKGAAPLQSQTILSRPGFSRTESFRVTVRAIEVQGRFSGVVSRGCSWAIDEGFALVTYALLIMVLESLTSLLKDDQDFTMDGVFLAVGYLVWTFSIRFIAIATTCRTMGMAILGIIVVKSEKGRRPGFFQILVRQLLQIVSSSIPGVNMLCFAIAWIRHDGRFPHDVLSWTGTVYSWDVRTASLRMRYTEQDDGEKKKSDRDDEENFYELQP